MFWTEKVVVINSKSSASAENSIFDEPSLYVLEFGLNLTQLIPSTILKTILRIQIMV